MPRPGGGDQAVGATAQGAAHLGLSMGPGQVDFAPHQLLGSDWTAAIGRQGGEGKGRPRALLALSTSLQAGRRMPRWPAEVGSRRCRSACPSVGLGRRGSVLLDLRAKQLGPDEAAWPGGAAPGRLRRAGRRRHFIRPREPQPPHPRLRLGLNQPGTPFSGTRRLRAGLPTLYWPPAGRRKAAALLPSRWLLGPGGVLVGSFPGLAAALPSGRTLQQQQQTWA